ncbi:MAG TPA: hypothetical protein VG456_25735 [Candidatus Sulfopaludibacter sp.]|jgi:riboflavin synthase alpha subunit|nr:hypothetical protein [Candidatus Sulfopaludibacter sp.]
MKRLIVTMIVFAIAAFAADISGNWKGTAEGPQGNLERSFVFKVDGTKLTGETTSQMLGKSTITDGKVEGDTITFTITATMQDNQVKLSYKGKVTADGIELSSEMQGGPGGQPITWHLKKEK